MWCIRKPRFPRTFRFSFPLDLLLAFYFGSFALSIWSFSFYHFCVFLGKLNALHRNVACFQKIQFAGQVTGILPLPLSPPDDSPSFASVDITKRHKAQFYECLKTVFETVKIVFSSKVSDSGERFTLIIFFHAEGAHNC